MDQIKEEKKKYYWLKLQKDFFKRHDMKIIESMPNGKDYILFYLKLLCESTAHNGGLRFSDEIPYNEEMLATITNTNVDVVKTAVGTFEKLNMITIMDDGTYFMNEVQKMVGYESKWAEKKRKQREQKVGHCPTGVLLVSDKRERESLELEKELDLELEKELDLEGEITTIAPSKTSELFGTFRNVELNTIEFRRCVELDIESTIDRLSTYMETQGKSYANNYATIVAWAKEDKYISDHEIESVELRLPYEKD